MNIQKEIRLARQRRRDAAPFRPNYMGAICLGLPLDATIDLMRAYILSDQIERYKIMHYVTNAAFGQAIGRHEALRKEGR